MVLEYARIFDSNIKAYKAIGNLKSTFYDWKKNHKMFGEEGLKHKSPIARIHPRSLSQEVVNKILELRSDYHLGSRKIHWYLQRYHGIHTSESSVYRTLVRNNESRLPKNASLRTVHYKRYAKKEPGYHIQVDFKLVSL